MKILLTILVFPLIAAVGLDFGLSYRGNSSNLPSTEKLISTNTTHLPVVDTLTLKDLDIQYITDQFNSDYILIKIANGQNEVISKWQGKTDVVLVETIGFLKKASEGSYNISGILKDGTKKFFVFDK